MIISKNNLAKTTISLINVASGVASDVQSPDFSRFIVSDTSNTTMTIEANVGTCDYAAVAGVNAVVGTAVAFQYFDGAWQTDATYTLSDSSDTNRTVMHEYSPAGKAGTDYRIVFTKNAASEEVTARYAAFGEICPFDVRPYGKRSILFGTPQYKQRTQFNFGMPTASYLERTALESSFSFENLSTSDYLEFESFASHALNSGFFIFDSAGGDVTNVRGSAYCFDVKVDQLESHSDTLALVGFSVKFKAWAGSLEVVD